MLGAGGVLGAGWVLKAGRMLKAGWVLSPCTSPRALPRALAPAPVLFPKPLPR